MKTPPDTKYLITDLKSARKNTLKKSYFKTRIFFKKNNIGKLQCALCDGLLHQPGVVHHRTTAAAAVAVAAIIGSTVHVVETIMSRALTSTWGIPSQSSSSSSSSSHSSSSNHGVNKEIRI